MLVELIHADHENNSGLQSYLRNMMRVLDFDAERRGKLVSQAELNEYTHWLAVAVTEALHYFIGHNQLSPQNGTRYLAVSGAHITHLLRDTLEDIQIGYFNIPCEYLSAKGISPRDVESGSYREWVRERVNLARAYFKSGREYLAEVENFRCRIAGYAYISRFELILDAFERSGYRFAPINPQGRILSAGIKMSRSVLSLAFFPTRHK
jgi:phytoene/squalene synthetase